MRPVSPTLATYLSVPGSYRTEVLYTIGARNRATNAVETAGFWSGDRHRGFVVDGSSILFYGAGSVIEEPELSFEAGLSINTFDVQFSPLSAEFIQVARVYDVRGQRFRMYEAYFDTATEKLIEAPTRIYKGKCNKLKITDADEGNTSTAIITVVSSARALTRIIPAKHSDETMRLRSDDRIGRYATISGTVQVPWGRNA